ncbi:hypothetical protein GUJ93_ZPchr0004g39904 [Zizania palustris]|uniref:protein-serine/threonine phosphatase n=1 Tax=Zizania palustris TaxID=103762 RepID=A0A8J5SE28_ZIZPA|nr:hypothetical protein GUJ93_ZPchr0004g39904 [Zizania palustris]
MDASVNAKKVSSCGSTGHSRCGEFHRPAWSCRTRDHSSLIRSNPFLLQVWFVFPFKYKKPVFGIGLFYKNSNDHSISSEEEDVLVRSCSNLNVSFGYHCNSYPSLSVDTDEYDISPKKRLETNTMMTSSNGSFTCLSGAAISANFTLANTNICELAMKFAENEDVKFSETFQAGVLNCLTTAVEQAENDFLCMVEQEMDDRPDLVSVGSCVLVVLLHGTDLCILNLGDSRAVLASMSYAETDKLKAVQLTETHSLENPLEYQKLLADHPNESSVVMGKKIKGKLKVTRAFGVGYLKQKKFNDALMGILRVRNLCTPPYVYTNPHTVSHKVTEGDLFVVLGSDGLFDFFSNDEVVELVYQFMHDNPIGDPAKYLIEQLLHKAAKKAALTAEELMRIPVGSRRKYHDDVTVIVIILGNAQRTTTASTSV